VSSSWSFGRTIRSPIERADWKFFCFAVSLRFVIVEKLNKLLEFVLRGVLVGRFQVEFRLVKLFLTRLYLGIRR